MNAPPVHDPEARWRRTVELCGRPLKLKVARLLKTFGHVQLEPGMGEAVEARLARVGLSVSPSLRDASASQVITLKLATPSAEPVGVALPDAADVRPTVASATKVSGRPATADPRPAAVESSSKVADLEPEEVAESVLVRAAVEAERRVRSSYERAAAATTERISGLERELTAEREATARARDERDDLQRRMHVERREMATRLQTLAAAERTARGLLETQRTEMRNLGQTVRVSAAAIAQTRETLTDVHGQVKQTATDVREALSDSARADHGAEIGGAEIEAAPAVTVPSDEAIASVAPAEDVAPAHPAVPEASADGSSENVDEADPPSPELVPDRRPSRLSDRVRRRVSGS